TPYYTYRDANGATQTGHPQLIGATVTGTLTPAGDNPMNVWYANNNVTLGDCTVNGTIVVRGAAKVLNLTGNPRVTRHDGLHGLLVSNSIRLLQGTGTKRLTVDGLCYTGNNITSTGMTAYDCEMIVNGALMMSGPASSPITPLYVGTITVNYLPQNVNIPDFSNTNKVPQSVKLVRWGL